MYGRYSFLSTTRMGQQAIEEDVVESTDVATIFDDYLQYDITRTAYSHAGAL